MGGLGVRAAQAIMRRVGVRAARAIVGRVRCKKEIFICGLKNNPYLCGCQNKYLMNNIITALNKAFLKLKPSRSEINEFKANFKRPNSLYYLVFQTIYY